MKGVILTITGNDLACARAWGETAEGRVQGENPTGLSEPHRYFKKYAGEIAWVRWCRLYGLRCRYYVETKGRSVDDPMIHLYLGGREKPFAVKTAGYSFYKQMMVPANRVDESAVYVGMRLGWDADTVYAEIDTIEVECCGLMSGRDVAALPVTRQKILSRCHPLNDLGALNCVRDDYDRGDLELRGRAVELEAAPPLRLTP